MDDGKREKAGAFSLSPFPSSPWRFHFSRLSPAPLGHQEAFAEERGILCREKPFGVVDRVFRAIHKVGSQRTLGMVGNVEQAPVAQKVNSAIHWITQ